MTDAEAKTVFYATNMGQRSELLPSERAAGYKALAGALRLEGSGAVDAVAQAGSDGALYACTDKSISGAERT